MRATILCYHKVGLEVDEGRRLNIEPATLETHVRYFARQGRFVLARDLGSSWPAGAVCFTFDDAYASTMAHAPDVLERHGARGTFYAVPGLVGDTSTWDGEQARPLADWNALRAAANRGHEIGNHTFTHPHLDSLPYESQAAEIIRADAALKSQGFLPASFCYPYGGLNEDSLRAVRGAGYPVGLALGKRLASTEEDRLRLSRIVVAFSDTLPLLLYRAYVRPRLRRYSPR